MNVFCVVMQDILIFLKTVFLFFMQNEFSLIWTLLIIHLNAKKWT